MEYFLDETGTKYIAQKIQDVVRVMPCDGLDGLDEVSDGQVACVPVTSTDYQDEYLTLSALEDGEGTFVKNSAATWNVTGVNGIPSGWTITTASA